MRYKRSKLTDTEKMKEMRARHTTKVNKRRNPSNYPNQSSSAGKP